jgi:hypothetical protein
MVPEDDAEGHESSQLENRLVVTILNPNTHEILTLNQQEFNRYMTMTNGAVLEWALDINI